jgi:hypothetical protein
MAKKRCYRVMWVRDDKGRRGTVADGPLTHREAVTILSKLVPATERSHRHVRYALEEISCARRAR